MHGVWRGCSIGLLQFTRSYGVGAGKVISLFRSEPTAQAFNNFQAGWLFPRFLINISDLDDDFMSPLIKICVVEA